MTYPEFTAKLKNLDVIAVTIWLEAYEFLARIIEDLIESPNRAFRRDYWLHLSQLEDFLDKANYWTLEGKIKTLNLRLHEKSSSLVSRVFAPEEQHVYSIRLFSHSAPSELNVN